MKILVIRFSSIGDIVLCSPVFRCLKKQIENAEIHFLTKESFKKVTQANPYIDRFFYFHKNMDDIIEQLNAENYDYVIDLHKNIRSIKIARSLKKKTFTIDKESVRKILLTKFKIDVMRGVHITQRCLETIRPLGVQDDGLGLDYFIPDTDKIRVEDLPVAHSAGFVGIVIGASYFTKKLPVYKLKELCSKINYPIILLGGKEDRAAGNQIADIDPVKIYNACGKFNLNESADIVRQSKLIISHDTGLQYIACAFQKPVLAIWGGTSPRLDVEPYYGTSFISKEPFPIYENIFLDLWCQPCSRYGTKSCPLGHFNCMNKQDIDLIASKANERLGV